MHVVFDFESAGTTTRHTVVHTDSREDLTGQFVQLLDKLREGHRSFMTQETTPWLLPDR